MINYVFLQSSSSNNETVWVDTQNASIYILYATGTTSIPLGIYREDGTLYHTFDTPFSNPNFRYLPFGTGRYYIRAIRPSNDTGTYSFGLYLFYNFVY